MTPTEQRLPPLIDGPSPFASRETWERHLSELERLPADTLGRGELLRHAREVIADKGEPASN